MDWVIFADHEESIYIRGGWLIEAITSEVPKAHNMLNDYVYR